jgi:hypothetical protein
MSLDVGEREMARVVVGKIKNAPRGGRPESVTEKRVRGADGRTRRLLVVDAGSETFSTDVQYVFARNVARARRENKRLIGTPDVALADV